jgi:transcriptional regulator PpsR
MFLVTIVPEANGAARVDPAVERALKLIEGAPDAIVICNEDGHVLSANPAFVELIQSPSVEHAVGQPLGNWLGRSSVDVNVLLANVRKSGRLRLYATSIRGALGVSSVVEVAGTVIERSNSDQIAYGFIIRSVEHRGAATGDHVRMRSADQLAELVGKVPLKELVRESADLIERMSIEAALDLTDNNRAAAAEMLGLSRQSLYVKLRRFGIGETEN